MSERKSRIGRPAKYAHVVAALDDRALYSPGKIARMASAEGYLEGDDDESRKRAMRRLRITMVRFVNNHFFPDEGDGMVFLPGQAPTPGWYGWRFKQEYLN